MQYTVLVILLINDVYNEGIYNQPWGRLINKPQEENMSASSYFYPHLF